MMLILNNNTIVVITAFTIRVLSWAVRWRQAYAVLTPPARYGDHQINSHNGNGDRIPSRPGEKSTNHCANWTTLLLCTVYF
ncbi:hypothetical protein DPMN_169761 [Dreissena polymorpha]|uniref:Uncharacterized protein n=1 Tax=Dreissena polymorpha TaxID=45954 RepID=A0A9D4IAX9_DREPO|nr:hypothetical protein DPMN_169761 [Dreissena polymorpha]